MLSARDLCLRRGPEPLLEHAEFTVYRGEKVGLTGANGSGKSSLFAALLGELSPDRGSIEMPGGLLIAHLEQEIGAADRQAIEFVLDGDVHLRRIEAAIARAEREDQALALAAAHAEYEAIDGYRARARAAAIMHGLGFRAADHERPVAEFSGGWRVRLAMARVLGSRADLLLLDEPTNHLDLDAILWLEDWLAAHPGTLIVISHDREFLDAVICRVLHLDRRRIGAYTGNYSDFERKRAEELATQSAMHARQTRRIAEIEAFVARFRAKATKSRQAQSRLKMLERMERIAPAHVDSPFSFEFEPPDRTPRPLVSLERAACGHDGRPLIRGIDAAIAPRDRIALLGENGAGKTTLMRALAGELAVLEGARTAAADLEVGYFAQHRLDRLNRSESPLWHLRHRAGASAAALDEQRMRDHLGRFGFRGDRVFEPVGRFSGGEKARLELALLVARRPNLLLLDEPTNHLDIEMRHALALALQEFQGGLVLVSHDRHLIKAVADTLWLVADGAVREFDGDLDDYQRWLKERRAAVAAAVAVRSKPPDGPSAVEVRAAAGAARRRLAPLRRELAGIEKRIDELGGERAGLEREFAAGETGSGKLARYAAISSEMAALEERWLEIGGALESAEAGHGG